MSADFSKDTIEHSVIETVSIGVREAFDLFLREQRQALVSFLCRRLPSEADAQDAAQESLARLVRYRDSEPPRSWKPLLYRIAANVAQDQLRGARSAVSGGRVSYDEDVHTLPAPALPQDERLDQQKMMARMWQTVQTLPPRCREVFLLNRVEAMSYSQIAELTGISVKAVEKHMSRALGILRQELGEWAPDPGRIDE